MAAEELGESGGDLGRLMRTRSTRGENNKLQPGPKRMQENQRQKRWAKSEIHRGGVEPPLIADNTHTLEGNWATGTEEYQG